MRVIGIIPARMSSTRFPGKPLAPILGRSMTEHVYRRCAMARSIAAVYVATCDQEIMDAVEAFRNHNQRGERKLSIRDERWLT